MLNLSKKIMYLIIFSIIVMIIACTPVSAKHLEIDSIQPNDNGGTAESMQSIAGILIAVVQVIGLTVAIVMLIVLAIKYLYSSPNDRAEIKKHMVVYVVGAVLLFGVSAVLGLIKSFAENMGSGEYTISKGVYNGRSYKSYKDSNGKIQKIEAEDDDGNEILISNFDYNVPEGKCEITYKGTKKTMNFTEIYIEYGFYLDN